MRILTKSAAVFAMAMFLQVVNVSAQQSFGPYPGHFPGATDFPEPSHEPFPEDFPGPDDFPEPSFGSFPERFPGAADFPEPMAPPDLPPAYPAWPERSVQIEMIPPPPGGPYMSSGLSDRVMFPSDPGGLRYEYHPDQMPSPFFAKDADTPWPEVPDRGRPQPWIPESGEYHFVPEEVVRQLESSTSGRRHRPMMYQPYPGYRPPPPAPQPGYGYR